jgi:cell volume regulation protein A
MGIPSLVVFLAIGMLAGSEGIAGIAFDDAQAAQSLGIIALCYILFSGGLDTKWTSIRPVLKSGVSLATLGVVLTCGLIGGFVHLVMGFGMLESFLIGAIVSSTDAGAVFTVLRGRDVHLKGELENTLELESGSNDPMAVFLTTSILQMMKLKGFDMGEMLWLLVQQMAIGVLFGYGMARLFALMLSHIKLQIEGLYLVLSIAFVMFIYSGTQELNGNGFLAVYIGGVTLGNQTFALKKSLALMHDGISWLMQSAMFLTLGLLIYPTDLMKVAPIGIFISLFMILIARPMAVWLSLLGSSFNMKEKTLLSWVGLRGSVPVILATYPLVEGTPRAHLIFNIVFFIAVTSLLIQGTSVPLASRLLKVNDPFGFKKKYYTATPGHLSDIVTFEVPPYSSLLSKSILELKLPHNVLIIAVERENEVIIPRGTTVIEPGDILSVMASDDDLADFYEKIYTPKPGMGKIITARSYHSDLPL